MVLTIYIDTVTALQELLNQIEGLPTDPPSLYIDLEGPDLGRHGSLSIISIFAPHLPKIYLIDVFKIGEGAFLVCSQNQKTFKTILESKSIPKVFFDVRDDSDALFSHYGIQLQCIKDLQVMELATRSGPKEQVSSLAECIERDSNVSPARLQAMRQIEASVEHLKGPGRRLGDQTINQRPISPAVIQYCAQNVVFLPTLLGVYHQKLRIPANGFWRSMVFFSVQKRLIKTQSLLYDPESDDKQCGWSESYIEAEINFWNGSLRREGFGGEPTLNRQFAKNVDLY